MLPGIASAQVGVIKGPENNSLLICSAIAAETAELRPKGLA
jgi:hypothetical protein